MCVQSHPSTRAAGWAVCETEFTCKVAVMMPLPDRAALASARSRGLSFIGQRATLRFLLSNVPRRLPHDAIGLAVATELEDVAADVEEAALEVKANRPRVALPHAKPDRACVRCGRAFNGAHECLRIADAMPRAIDVKAHQLNRRPIGDALRRLAHPQLRVPDERGIPLSEQRRHLRIFDLRELP